MCYCKKANLTYADAPGVVLRHTCCDPNTWLYKEVQPSNFIGPWPVYTTLESAWAAAREQFPQSTWKNAWDARIEGHQRLAKKLFKKWKDEGRG